MAERREKPDIGWMSSEAPVRRREDWQQLISEHKQSGLTVKAFCQRHGVSEALFYSWRKRVIAEDQPARFALVATNGVAPSAPATTTTTSADRRRAPGDSVGHRRSDAADCAWLVAATCVIHLPASVRVYLCLTACDMRKSFDSLAALVRSQMELDPLGGHLYVFWSRRKDRVKILYWDRDGFAVWAKRLEEGTYALPFFESGEVRREITAQELAALLSGIDLNQAKRRKRYNRVCK